MLVVWVSSPEVKWICSHLKRSGSQADAWQIPGQALVETHGGSATMLPLLEGYGTIGTRSGKCATGSSSRER